MKIIAILTALLIPFMVRGATYQWVDKDGIRHFGDKSHPQVEKQQSNNNSGGHRIESKSDSDISIEIIMGEKTSKKPLTITAPKVQSPPPAVTDNAKPTTSVSTDSGRNTGRSGNNNAPRKAWGGSLKSAVKASNTTSNTKKVSAKKPAVRAPAKSKTKLKAIAVKKTKIKRKPKPKQHRVMKKTTVNGSNEKNAELCIVYTRYVKDYRKKLKLCSSGVCKIYQSSLIRYQNKQQKHC